MITPKGAEIFLRFDSEEALRTGKERVVSVLPTENGVVAYKVAQPFKLLQQFSDLILMGNPLPPANQDPVECLRME